MQLVLAVALLAIATAERVPRLRLERQPFLRGGFGTDLVYLATGALALGLAMRHMLAWIAGADVGALPGIRALPTPLAIGVATVLFDLASYLVHWGLHRSSALWRLHEVHHSSPRLDWLATFRAHAGEHALRHLVPPALLLGLGFPVSQVAAATAIYTAWAAFNHSNLRLPLRFLEPLLVTPRLHRLHHVARTSGKNLGTIFSCWDRLRGTLVADPQEARGPLGVPGREKGYPQTWCAQLIEPFRGAGGRTSAA